MPDAPNAPPGVDNEWLRAACLADLPEGRLTPVVAGGEFAVILISLNEDEVFALPARCGECQRSLVDANATLDAPRRAVSCGCGHWRLDLDLDPADARVGTPVRIPVMVVDAVIYVWAGPVEQRD